MSDINERESDKFWESLTEREWEILNAQFVHGDALEILCRVFNDDHAMSDWLEWYQPKQWLSPQRALGAFIYTRLRDGAA